MRYPKTLTPGLIAGLIAATAGPAPGQLVRTIENHDPGRQRPAPRPTATASAVPGARAPQPRPSPRPTPWTATQAPPPLDYGPASLQRNGLAPTPNVARWHGRGSDRTLGRTDLVWYANRAWRCRREDGTTGRVSGISPYNLLFRHAEQNRKQTLDSVIRRAAGSGLARQVDSGIVVCR